MRVLITGANGFVGKNLTIHLQQIESVKVVPFTRTNQIEDLPELLDGVDWVFHLAGVNRPDHPNEFIEGNSRLTELLCSAIRASGRHIPVAYSSSIRVEDNNDYGRSKLAAEEALIRLKHDTGNPVFIYRLPNVFGKWSKPNYNSAVATFCHNMARDLPIQVDDPTVMIRLVYVDDVIDSFLSLIFPASATNVTADSLYVEVSPEYKITVGNLADQIRGFRDSRNSLSTDRVGTGLTRALYSTYLSFLPPASFAYSVPQHSDPRGTFVEMLKTPDCGQFSFFSALPGITRGGHYHHTKTEKFLVIKGKAKFGFRHMLTNETFQIETSGDNPQMVETVPGWTHDVTNVGDEELLCMLWANEIFDRDKPDTYHALVNAEN